MVTKTFGGRRYTREGQRRERKKYATKEVERLKKKGYHTRTTKWKSPHTGKTWHEVWKLKKSKRR